ncbi:response regulator transcription factor [Polluticoccus soli]|uniref:response regulator transcription factor n=1 Tax=Polluticoccus soli TaxID=3034150 RepID=UPI0023E09D05|nr:response regulator transcription factor [Flavipsychrobacter sp. JY13-12]
MERILLVEDDATINQNIRETLSAESFEVDHVFDGGLADRLLKKNKYDCIILDINLPNKTGYAICKDFRQHNTVTPILILTAFDELEDKVQGYDSGADDYLTKPFYMKELVLRVNALLKRSKKSEGTEIAGGKLLADDIIIDTARGIVTRQGTEIILTPREFQILVRLVSSKGELVSKRDLVKEIWGTSFDSNTNTVEVYINFLRKKLDKPFGKDSIKTKIGFGYYFDEH